MNKVKSVWSCIECGFSQNKWSGQCGGCGEWNTLNEERALPIRFDRPVNQAIRLKDVKEEASERILTQNGEFDRLLGGGIVKGSLMLVGGDPGIGKSTLMLQVSSAIAKQGLVVLYVCGEESVLQTSMRAKRLGVKNDDLLLLSETNLEAIKEQVEKIKPDLLVIDSIQILYKGDLTAAPGSISQVRECANDLMHLAKSNQISTFLIGHVTKSGELAGPRVLEHIVDTVLYFEGEKQHNYRMLRGIKNRFGSTDELAVFQMSSDGLKEVPNPSLVFLEERVRGQPGSVVVPTIEGSRPILVEMQALVTESKYATPTRKSTGFDGNRLALLLAVLEKRVGFLVHNRDIFVSVTGGMRTKEPAMDLPAIIAVSSSFTNRLVDPEIVVMGEVGLAGEVRAVNRIETRVKEAVHLGFKKCIVPARHLKALKKEKIEVIGVSHVEEAIRAVLD